MSYNPADIIRELRQRDLYDLAEAVATAHQCTVFEMVGTVRYEAFCRARHELWYRLRCTGHWSYPRIAELVHRDDSTVMHGVRKAQAKAKVAA